MFPLPFATPLWSGADRYCRVVLPGGTLEIMELHLTPRTQAKLNDLAQRTHRGTDELLEEAVDHLVAYNEWFEDKIQSSLEAAGRGETVPDEDVRAWLEQRERS